MKASNLNIAIIGLGNIGSVVASNLVKGQQPVIVADIDPYKASSLAQELGSLATAMDVRAAIQAADVVVLAIYFDAIRTLFATYNTELQGKILIDPSNPIAPDGNGGFKKIIGQGESAGELLAAILPAQARLVKALGTLGAATLAQAAFNEPRKVLFYALDDRSLQADIESLIQASGYAPVHVGGLDQSIRIEVFGELHEYGALGKAVTLAEAVVAQ